LRLIDFLPAGGSVLMLALTCCLLPVFADANPQAAVPVAGAIEAAPADTSATPKSAADNVVKNGLELVGTFDQMMPRGLAVAKDGRVFVCFPRYDQNGPYTVGVLKDGNCTAFPDAETNRWDATNAKDRLVSVLGCQIDNKNRLWLLDSGRVGRDEVPGAAKLVALDLQTGAIVKNFTFPPDVALPTTVLKDLRIVSRIGKDGTAIIGDPAPLGKSGLIVIDLETGKSFRRLHGHPSVTAEPDFVVFAEGEMVRMRVSEDNKTDWTAGVAGLALSPDTTVLYYSPLAGLALSSISVDALCNPAVSEAAVEKTIKALDREVGTSDGLESDSQNRLYLTDVENNEIWRRDAGGTMQKLVRDERLIWPDRLCLAADGYLYVTASQFHRGPWFHFGQDMRQRPFHLYRIKVDASPAQMH
jgi:sugar lactone lactonase YvrE